MNSILKLSYQRIKRSRKNSLFIFLVLILSFSCAIVSVSVIGSINKTNAEYMLDTYGEWYFAMTDGYKSDESWLSQREWVNQIGISKSVGSVTGSNTIAGIGTVDETFVDIGRISLTEGGLPSSENEIAMEKDLLSALGYDYTLGQEITVNVSIPLVETMFSSEVPFSAEVEKTYTLCGIIREYSNLWYLDGNTSNLNSAIISPAAADELISDAKKELDVMIENARKMREEMLANAEETGDEDVFIDFGSMAVRQPVLRYFITVSEENREAAEGEIKDYLKEQKKEDMFGARTTYCKNDLAYLNSTEDASSFYIYMIALLTFISVICLEIIRLPSNTHSFSILRSIGMSKKQLALMQLSEILILGVPAILLGIPLGAGLTWLALRLTLFSGSVPIIVDVPYNTLFSIIALWIAAIILSRLIIFAFTLRVPMTGKMQMNTSRSRRTRILRSGFIVLLLCIFSECTVYAGMSSLGSILRVDGLSQEPSYQLWADIYSDNQRFLSQDDINAIGEIPGITEAIGYNQIYIGLSFDGETEEAVHLAAKEKDIFLHYNMVNLVAVNENDWTDILDLGNDKEAFHNGEFVFVAFPSGTNIPGEEKKEYTMPKGKANINIYEYEYVSVPVETENDEYDDGFRKGGLIESREVKTRNIVLPRRPNTKGVWQIETPYAVICSEHFFEDMIKSLPQGHKCGNYITGTKVGYFILNAMTDLNAESLATDTIIAKMCKDRRISLTNNREAWYARIQAEVQDLIMLFFSGACIGIIALMILLSNISLETENEKRGFLIKRCIGMSKRQADARIIGKTALRCLGAFTLSFVSYILWSAFTLINVLTALNLSLFDAIESIMRDLIYFCQQYGFGIYAAILLIGLILPTILILHSKKDLGKDGDIK